MGKIFQVMIVVLMTQSSVVALAEPGKIEDTFLAATSDQQIKNILSDILPISFGQLEEYGSTAALALTQINYSTKPGSYRFVENHIWWVKEGEAEDLTTYLRDFSPDQEITDVRAFVIRSGEFSVNAALESPVERLGEDQIHLQDDRGKDKMTNLVVAFESAGPGDIIGVSIAGKVHHSLWWKTWYLADELPVARAQMRVFCDELWAYSVFGQRFKSGQIKKEILGQHNGQVRDLLLRADSIAPYCSEPYSPSGREQSPTLRLVWRAYQFSWDGKRRLWWYYDSWNQIAVKMAAEERQYLDKTKKVDKLARSMAADRPAIEAADLLYQYVRDELQTVSLSRFNLDKDEPTVEDILKVGAGEDFEKVFLLLAMLRALDIPAEIIWAHDSDNGKLFEKYPSWGQMDNPLVRAFPDGNERWYDLNCPTCQGGVIHPKMRGAVAMSYLRDADLLHRKLTDELIAEAWGRELDYFDFYIRRISPKNWHTMLTTPGSAVAKAGFYSERIKLDTASSGAPSGQAEFQIAGFVPLRTRLGQGANPEEEVETWFARRFPDAEVDSVLAMESIACDTIQVLLDFAANPVQAPMGDTWIIPAKALVGQQHIDDWPEPRTSPFTITQAREYFWEIQIPLPEGWADAEVPSSCQFGFKCLLYRADFKIQAGHLVMRRHLVEKVVNISDQKNLGLIGLEVRKINEFEATPVVLQRIGSVE